MRQAHKHALSTYHLCVVAFEPDEVHFGPVGPEVPRQIDVERVDAVEP